MRVGRTTAIHFLSKFGSSVIGFVAMIYFARALGSGELGIYFLVLSVVGWLRLGNNMGISLSLMKRLSENNDKNQHLSAALSLIVVAFFIVSLGIYLAQDMVNSYLGGELYTYVILLLAADIAFMIVGSIMKGEHLVHAQALVSVSETILRVIFQVVAVIFGLGTIGLVFGKSAATAVISLVAIILLLGHYNRSLYLSVPSDAHYRSLINYAKFSWLGSMKGKIYQRMDIIVLGFFVPANLIGIYSICWNIASVLEIFSKSLSTTLFPEISHISSENGISEATSYLEDALTYAGLIIIPGFIGTIIIGGNILSIYGSEFKQGYTILIILSGSALIHSYHKQFMNTMDAVDRPDLTFRVNIFFSVTNVILNIILVYLYGWTGAAVATLLSITAAIFSSYWMLSGILNFVVPYGQIFRQILSSVVMGLTVFGQLNLLNWLGVDAHGFVLVILSVCFGVFVYFSCLAVISHEFRDLAVKNLSM